MPTVSSHALGSFCWIELATSDQSAAKTFYSSLFGWTPNDTPMGPGDFYTIFRLDGQAAAAAYTLRSDQRAQGVPPHWRPYFAVENADNSARRAAELGGKVLVPAFDLMTSGRMAVVQDPAGAAFTVWQAKEHIGTGITGVNGTLCWADLSTPDRRSVEAFYSALFGWNFMKEDEDPEHGYWHIKAGDEFIAGIPPATHRSPNTPAHWLAYFQVADCDALAARAEELGAKFFVRPMTMEKVGRLAVLADPQAATFAIFQPSPR
jgi:predicted enzyme related to lactoylglutathione lyase